MSATICLTNPTNHSPVLNSSRIAYAVGGLSFGISSAVQDLQLTLDGSVIEFQTDAARNCDVEVEVGWSERLALPDKKAAFESGGLWSAYAVDGGTAFYFQTDYLGREPYKFAWFNNDFSHGHVSLLRRYYATEIPVYPLEYPLDELLMIHRISRGQGVEVHGCGVVTEDGVGRLFIGHSGAGKSTSSRLWLKQPGAQVLSDDRIIVRHDEDGAMRMYGTPWHGDAGLAAQANAPLRQIFLLEHGTTNEIIPLHPARAAAEIFTRVFVPHHNGVSLQETLAFIEKMVSAIPAARFRFRPDESAIEEILRAS
ncbi:MAG: hypothetical protein JSS69_14445 [Acidobacteria bacterium]|nr:hypothetical protein [Acidobacteriota bacterium]MBS1867111.1 hypothetical protein [Acidobacteriota bacterium]